MVSKSVVDINVVIVGPTKTSLIPWFVSKILPVRHEYAPIPLIVKHNHIYQRAADGRSFRFITSEHEGSSSDASWEDFQFILVALEFAQASDSIYSDITKLFPQISRSACQACILLTKVDYFAQDLSDSYCRFWTVPTKRTFLDDLQYYGVSAFDGTGISDVQRYIVDQVHPLMAVINPFESHSFFGRSLSWFLDIVARLFSLPVPDKVNQSTPDPIELDDSTVDNLVEGPETAAWDDYLRPYTTFGYVSIHKITPTLLAKGIRSSERENMSYVRQHTNIPVPQPRYPHLSSWLVMDFVKGRMLLDCWDAQSTFMKFRIACTMRIYISQLRRLSGSIPGTVAGGIVSGVLFEDEDRGPFQDFTGFRRYYEMVSQSGWASVIRARRGTTPAPSLPHPPVKGVDWSLVFTHADLNLGNIVLSDDGVLWIIDWETSGFFPPWFETVGLRYFDNGPKSWQRFRWFMAGSYPKYERLWDFFMDEVHHYQRWSGRTLGICRQQRGRLS